MKKIEVIPLEEYYIVANTLSRLKALKALKAYMVEQGDLDFLEDYGVNNIDYVGEIGLAKQDDDGMEYYAWEKGLFCKECGHKKKFKKLFNGVVFGY